MCKRRPRPESWLLAALGVCSAVAAAGCDSAGHPTERFIRPAVIVMALPEALGPAERPPTEFPHDKHFKALEQEDCKACHRIDDKLGVLPTLAKQPETFSDADDLTEFFHDTCIGCHEKRRLQGNKSGPETCGECHVIRVPTTSTRVAARWDYSLHHRHVQATVEQTPEGPKDRCGTCHHAYNEAKKTREYKKGAEASCRDCHGDKDEITKDKKQRSLRNASHIACINCHREEQKKADKTAKGQDKPKTGPIDCMGCHDASRRAAIETIAPDKIKRLKIDKQPDRAWVETAKTTANLVPFDHKKHEPLTQSCRGCHHDTLKPCSECHPVTGSDKGGRVTLEQAHHDAASGFACVGCHEQAVTGDKACAGCHHLMTPPPHRQACRVCHRGPLPPTLQPAAPSAADAADELEPPAEPSPAPDDTALLAELFSELKLAPLPRPSQTEFPDKISIDIEGKLYQPTEMPHLKIVKKLYDEAAKSKLANRFHGSTEALCAGCHHHSPVDKRPPPCRSCHGQAASATKDKPALTNAYHRQCIGCHQQMAHKAQGCTDCHKKTTSAEVPR